MKLRWAIVVLVLAGLVALVMANRLARAGGFGTRSEPTVVERVLARTARRASVPRSARAATNPVAFSQEVWDEARAHFADHCSSCHANDGSGNTEIGRNLYPKAPDMRLPPTQALTDGEIYWIIENGVRLTGMPAWGDGTDHDADTWKLVHFIRRLDRLTADDLAVMASLNPKSPAELEEERQDKEFLAGKDVDDAQPDHAHHHEHKE